MEFKLFLEDTEKRPIVSFDFDGVLHTDVHPGTIHPINYFASDLTPDEEMHDQLRKEAKDNDIIVVSARHAYGDMYDAMEEFIRNYKLPVKKIYATSGMPKRDLLEGLGVIRHYDDKDMTAELAGTDIEFVLVGEGGKYENIQ